MTDSRLVEILKSFNEEDIKSFGKFLDSPIVNSRRKISLLFEYLLKYYPEFESPKMEKEFIYGKLFPGSEYDDKKISNYINDLTKAAEDYLMYDSINSDSAESLMYVSRGFYKKKLYGHALKVINRIEKKLVPGFSSNKNYFSIIRKINYLKSVYYSDSDFKKAVETEHSSFEIAAIQFLVDYTWMMCEKETGSGTLFTKEKNNLSEIIAQSFDIKKFINMIDKFDGTLAPIALLHYKILKTIDEPGSAENYISLRDMFYENITLYDREERFMIFGHLLNSCGEKIREYRMDEYAKEMFEVYKKMLEHDSYSKSESEYLLVIDYRNIMMLAILFNDAEFLKRMYEKYSSHIDPEQKADIVHLSEANYYFMKKEFERCQESVSGIRNENFVFKLDLRILKLKIYYELGYIEEAYSLIDSHKHFISNTKDLSELTKKSNRMFLKAYSELLKIKSGNGKMNVLSLHKEIDNIGRYQFKDWFLSKAEELKKKPHK